MEENLNILRVSNVTHYNKKTYVALNNALFFRKFIILTIVCLIIALIGLLMILFKFSNTFGFIYIGFGIFAPLFFFLMFKMSISKAVKTGERLNGKDLLVTFNFYDNYLEYSGNSDKGSFNSKMYYTDYFKCVETKEYYFLLVQKNQAHCIEKSGFNSTVELEEARKLLDKISLKKKGNKS